MNGSFFSVSIRRPKSFQNFFLYKTIVNVNRPSPDSQELAEKVIMRMNLADITFTIRSFRTIYGQPSARKLVFARLKSRLPDDLNWFLRWLWGFSMGELKEYPNMLVQDDSATKEKLKSALISAERLNRIAILKNTITKERSEKLQILPKLITNLVASTPTFIIEEISVCIDEYSKELYSAEQLCTRLIKICNIHVSEIMPLFSYLSIQINEKIKKQLKMKYATRVELVHELSFEISRFVEHCPTWIQQELAERQQQKLIGNNKTLSNQAPTKEPRIDIHCFKVILGCKYVISREDIKAVARNRTFFIHGLRTTTTIKDIQKGLLGCGAVERCDLYPVGLAEGSEHFVSIPQVITTKSSNSAVTAHDNTDDNAHPIVGFTSMSVRSQIQKAKRDFVLKAFESDVHALVTMKTIAGYNAALGEDVRLLGVAIKGVLCHTQPATSLTTLYVYSRSSLTVEGIRNHLWASLGPDFSIDSTCTMTARPVFVHLSFQTHEEAWLAHHRLRLSQEHEKDFPLAPSWLKSVWYERVANKAKEMLQNTEYMKIITSYEAESKKLDAV